MFFFFKQKTAYEMRISDWSSDVCSSDLDAATRVEATDGDHAHRPQGQRQDDDGGEARTAPPEAGVQADARGGRPVPDGGRRAAAEIGRASCRERVCQYV